MQPDMPYIVSYNEMLKGFLKMGDYTAFDQLLKEIMGGKRTL